MKRFRLGAQALALTCALIALPTTLSAAKPETRPAVSTAAIPTDYKEICNALPAKGLQHPYLVFNEAQKPAILEYIKTNKRAGDIYRMLQLEGERYLRVDADPAPAMNDIKSRFSGKDDHAAYQNYYQYGSVVCALLYGRHRLRETRIPARRETMRDGYVAAQRALFRKYLHARMALRG